MRAQALSVNLFHKRVVEKHLIWLWNYTDEIDWPKIIQKQMLYCFRFCFILHTSMVVELVQSDALVIHHRMCYILPPPLVSKCILHYSYKYAKFCTFIKFCSCIWYNCTGMLLFCLFKVERNIEVWQWINHDGWSVLFAYDCASSKMFFRNNLALLDKLII